MNKRIISVILTVLLLASCFVFGSSAAETETPTIYISGQGQTVFSSDGRVIYTGGRVPTPDGYLEEAVKKCMPYFINAVLFEKWEEYHDAFMEIWNPIYEDIRLDKNGEPSNGSYCRWNPETVALETTGSLKSYGMSIDWRLDPFVLADQLNTYIQRIKAKTMSPKVNVIGRCEGANVVMAYLAKYGYDDLNCVELYASAANGVDMIGALFSGDLEFYPQELQAFYYGSGLSFGDENVTSLVNSAMDWLVDTYGLEGACELLKGLLPDFYENVMYDVLLSSYGSFPGMWACVGPQYYAVARRVLFNGREDEYAGLIEKLDRYDREVRQRNNELLLKAKKAGVKIAVLTKYGEFTFKVPICRECRDVSDDAINVRNTSFGATMSDTKYVQFSEKYLSKADPRYISPCKRINASTCVLPDTTWFIYNCNHNNFDPPMEVLLKRFIDMDGEMTVDTFPDLPQYMILDENRIRKMTEDDVIMDFDNQQSNDFLSRFIRAIRSFFEMIRATLSMLLGGIG